ncbi:hypothetical protein TrRE_jg12287 [Triparma retinervis]|uniref:Uncharacterized protein n=1 Tax=Triparma retinervis TaxID=2557542 RepID=A0A9W7E6R0_9STRA|nr:hypothetical protein TrRE_jg12287 [Triparma retinervis]
MRWCCIWTPLCITYCLPISAIVGVFFCNCKDDGAATGAYRMTDNKGNLTAFVPVDDGTVACFSDNIYINNGGDDMKVKCYLEK